MSPTRLASAPPLSEVNTEVVAVVTVLEPTVRGTRVMVPASLPVVDILRVLQASRNGSTEGSLGTGLVEVLVGVEQRRGGVAPGVPGD